MSNLNWEKILEKNDIRIYVHHHTADTFEGRGEVSWVVDTPDKETCRHTEGFKTEKEAIIYAATYILSQSRSQTIEEIKGKIENLMAKDESDDTASTSYLNGWVDGLAELKNKLTSLK